jgi:hypothetical protein
MFATVSLIFSLLDYENNVGDESERHHGQGALDDLRCTGKGVMTAVRRP